MMAMRAIAVQRPARQTVAAIAAVLCAFALVLGMAQPAQAADIVLPGGEKTLVIHPGIEGTSSDQPGTGLPPASSVAGIAGHEFEVKQVPGFNLEKTVDWNRAVDMTPAEAASLVAGEPIAAVGDAQADNSIVFSGLETGIYLVTETAAPNGELHAVPFLVMLPMRHPTDADGWLTTVHVFPKTAFVTTQLGVTDDAAVVCGDPVMWSATNVIPSVSELGSYRVENLLAPGVTLTQPAEDAVVEITGQPALENGVDYTSAETTVEGRTAIETTFTESGIEKLLIDTNAEVKISFESRVDEPGEYTNEVRLFAGDAGAVTDTATTKFGPLRILVHERGNEDNLIANADFMLFMDRHDATDLTNPILVNEVEDLRTNGDGTIDVPCLRYSDFANGLDQTFGSELHRDYFANPIAYPAGWTGEHLVLRGDVVSATDPAEIRTVVWRATPIDGILSSTGGKITAIALLGGVLVAAGFLIAARRRREPQEG